jgi:chemotaxis signal transduction protein
MTPALDVTLVTFRSGTRDFALPVAAVERVLAAVEVLPLPGAPPHVAGAINLHGGVTPVLDLAIRFGAAPHAPSVDSALVIVQTASRRVALLADTVSGVTTLPGEALISGAAIARGAVLVSGIAAAGDGLIYVFDPETFFSLEEEALLDAALEMLGADS